MRQMRLNWKLWVNARSEQKALKLCERILERMEQEASEKVVEPYPKIRGFVVSFVTSLEHERWNDAVVEAIALGQRVGHGWALSGSIHEDPSGWSCRTNLAGVEAIEWLLLERVVGGAG
jgi:hypothetical protein